MLKWVENEMQSLDLHDQRLNRRATLVLEDLAHVGESQPDAMRSKAALDGAYRLMNNAKVTPEGILKPHHQQSIARTAEHSTVVLVQDTTEVELTKPNRQVEGAGPLDDQDHRGFFLHPLMAYSLKAVPLGLVSSIHWTREQLDTGSSRTQKKRRRNARPIEEKESFRWVEMTKRGQQIARENPQTTYVGVSDSEGDVYEVFAASIQSPANYHILTRACQDRALVTDPLGTNAGDEQSVRTINALIQAQPMLFGFKIHVKARTAKRQTETRKRKGARDQRVAHVQVRACAAVLRPPWRSGKNKLPEVACNLVEVREIDPPASAVPVVWVLVSTLPINTEQDIRQIIEIYKLRWFIELYFRVLKSGLGVERLKYQTLSRYLNATMPLLIVAWRVQLLTQAARNESKICCEAYLDENQWKPLFLVANPGQSLPKAPPSIGECLLMIAVMGGYIDKKAQGPPGTQTVWRGLRRLEVLTQAFDAFGPKPE